LELKNIDYDFVDVKKKPIDFAHLKKIADSLGIDAVFNMRGPTFRKMKLTYNEMSDKEKLNLLFENQGMIKRPLLENDNNFQVGFDEDKILNFVRS